MSAVEAAPQMVVVAPPAPQPQQQQQQQQPDPHHFLSVDCAGGLPAGSTRAPSPALDVYAVLGLPRPKRPSDRAERGPEPEEAVEAGELDGREKMGSDTDDVSDSDEDAEEGEYLVMDGPEDDVSKEDRTRVLSEKATHSRLCLLPVFTACTMAYDQWLTDNERSVTDDVMNTRRQQLTLYKKVVELYGSDAEWEGLTHAQRVSRNSKAHEASLEAKRFGAPPESVIAASVAETKL